jgi:predicted NUDIX family NTP pyrophosphohydrolase
VPPVTEGERAGIVPPQRAARASRSKRASAGILLYRWRHGKMEIFLVHPGGPYWARKDLGSWSIPKGEYEQGEQALDAAKREFQEETGFVVDGPFTALPAVRQPSGKLVTAWAVEGELDAASLRSNCFALEWPPRSGLMQNFPEVDRGEWFSLLQARDKIVPGQRPLLESLVQSRAEYAKP